MSGGFVGRFWAMFMLGASVVATVATGKLDLGIYLLLLGVFGLLYEIALRDER